MANKEEILNKIIQTLKEFDKQFISSAKRIIEAGDGKLYKMDLFASTVNNRAIALINGFVTLSESNNYISAVPLIRMQVDNALRFYAATLVADYNDFFDKYLSGMKIADIKDHRGKNLTDNYLAKELEKHFPGIYALYQNTSGYIHLSNEHAFINTALVSGKERTIGIRVGNGYDFFDIDRKIDFAFNMQEASKIVLVVVEQWKHQKDKLHADDSNNNE